MKRLLFFLLILILSVTLNAQRKSGKEVVTLAMPTDLFFSYSLPNANMAFTFNDVMSELDALRKKYPKLTHNDSVVFAAAYHYISKHGRIDIKSNDAKAKPEELAFEYLLRVHVAAALLSEGKAMVRNSAGTEVEQISKQRLKNNTHTYDSYTFSFVKGDPFFTGDVYAPESGYKNNIAPDLSAYVMAQRQKSNVKRTTPETKTGTFQDNTGDIVFEDPVKEPSPESQSEDTAKIYLNVDVSPEPPGGQEKYTAYLLAQQRYPEKSLQTRTEGKVFVRFIVNTDGTVQDLQIVKGVNKELEMEAMRLIKEGGKWTSAQLDGRKVRAQYVVSVTFSLK